MIGTLHLSVKMSVGAPHTQWLAGLHFPTGSIVILVSCWLPPKSVQWFWGRQEGRSPEVTCAQSLHLEQVASTRIGKISHSTPALPFRDNQSPSDHDSSILSLQAFVSDPSFSVGFGTFSSSSFVASVLLERCGAAMGHGV